MSTAPAPEHSATAPAHRGRRRDRVGREMKFRVTREVLADAVAWTARSLPPRPSVPVLAGILLEVEGNQLSVSGFDYEVSARAEVDVHATEGGRALVPGRLLAEITRALPPHPLEITAEGPHRRGGAGAGDLLQQRAVQPADAAGGVLSLAAVHALVGGRRRQRR